MINPICNKCKKELGEFGAILWSPPMKNFMGDREYCHKYHICPDCYIKLLKWIENENI